MAYAQDLGSCGLRPVWVRLPPGAREASSRRPWASVLGRLVLPDAELVALGIAEARPRHAVLVVTPDELGAESEDPLRLGVEVRGTEVDVHAVLRRLALGNLDEHQARPDGPFAAQDGDELVDGLDLVAGDAAPEARQLGRIGGVERDAVEVQSHARRVALLLFLAAEDAPLAVLLLE